MYKSFLVALILIISTTTIFAGVNPPQAVLTAFKQKFPTVTKVEWEKENATEYEANFEMSGTETSANFKEDGTWVETETEVAYFSLPEAVKKSFEKQVTAKPKEASKIDKPNGVTYYEVEYKDGVKTIEVLFNADGTLVK